MITISDKDCALVSAAGNEDSNTDCSPYQNMTFSDGVQIFIGDIIGENASFTINLQDGNLVGPYGPYEPHYPPV